MKRKLPSSPAAVLTAMALLAPSSARADWELWTPVELRVPVLRTPTPDRGRLDWRVIAEARHAGRTEGLQQLFFRTGPLVYLTRFLFVGVHAAFVADALGGAPPIRMEEELRAEVEPTFFGRLGPFTWVSRNRLEYRWRQTYQRLRARSQLRVNYAPQGWRVMPFLQTELLVDLTDTRLSDATLAPSVQPTPGLNQTRSFAGLGLQVLPRVRVDVSFLLRSRLVPGTSPGTFDTTLDQGLWLQLFIDIPPTN
jgi:hypothetical protein